MKLIEIKLSEEFEHIEIFPLTDLHIGGSGFKEKMFESFIKMVLDKPNRFVLLGGDLMNNGIKSSKSNTYTETMNPMEQKKWLKKNLYPIKDRILAMVEGNHEYRTFKESGQCVSEDIAEYLGITERFHIDECYIKISFGRVKGYNPRCYGIYLTHGAGGGTTTGGAVNKYESVGQSLDADIYVFGHCHKKFATKTNYRRMDLIHNKIVEVERMFVASSHWSEFGGYAARALLKPSACGTTPIYLYAKQRQFNAIV